jgi:hypothetical protein
MLFLVRWRYSASDGSDNYPYTLSPSGSNNNAPIGSFIKITVKIKHRPLCGFFPFLSNRSLAAYVTMRREAV